MSATNSFEDALLALILKGTAIANIADNAASSPATNLYISLHTGDPGETGNQTTNETAYTGYSRVAVTRDSDGWTVSGGADNAAQITFGKCTGNLQTLTHLGIGLASSGTGTLLASGALDESITLLNQMTPVIEAGNLDVICD